MGMTPNVKWLATYSKTCLICGHQEGGANLPLAPLRTQPVKEANAQPNNCPTKELRDGGSIVHVHL